VNSFYARTVCATQFNTNLTGVLAGPQKFLHGRTLYLQTSYPGNSVLNYGLNRHKPK